MNFRDMNIMEWIIIAMIFVIVLTLGVGGYRGYNNPNISVGVGGMVETRCIEGYKFVIGQDGRLLQVLDSLGKGVPCR